MPKSLFIPTTLLGTCVLATALLPACLERPLEPIEPRTTSGFTESVTQSKVDKIDILLAIDNSGSMADKQQILREAVPELVGALVNPPCVDDDNQIVAKPATGEACPMGKREFEPIEDIHIGVISSSLGAPGAPSSCASLTGNDKGRLLARIDPNDPEKLGPTYQNTGFLVWRPDDSAQAGLYGDDDLLTDDLGKMLLGVGDEGCGYEASLESWYRFLVDPEPYAEVTYLTDENGAHGPNELTGVDDTLLTQRRDFLRPDSLVAILMLTDENDCSVNPSGHAWAVANPKTLAAQRDRAECASDPNDTCCAPCGQAPESCPADPVCEELLLYNLTCYEQKQRFGVDFLHPTSRYVDALTKTEIVDHHGASRPNPLLVNADGTQRGEDRVFLAGIVGVPWQLVARNPNDLTEGLQSADELAASGAWDRILGDPANGVAPTDPHMLESIHPRPGLPGPESAPDADPIHGHEYIVHTAGATGASSGPRGDLQYACTFPIDPLDCDVHGCDCGADDSQHHDNNPLCQTADGSYGTMQQRAKGYPGLRQLEVLKGLGDQAIVGSICPAQLTDPDARDYGYQPAIEALVARLKQELKGACLPRSLTPEEGKVDCMVLEARSPAQTGGSCSCDLPGRVPVTSYHSVAVKEALQSPEAAGKDLDCFCEIQQLDGDALHACQYDTSDDVDADGWCYIDGSSFPKVGDDALVDHCPANQKRLLRFVGGGEPINEATVFISCQNG